MSKDISFTLLDKQIKLYEHSVKQRYINSSLRSILPITNDIQIWWKLFQRLKWNQIPLNPTRLNKMETKIFDRCSPDKHDLLPKSSSRRTVEMLKLPRLLAKWSDEIAAIIDLINTIEYGRFYRYLTILV